MQYIYEGESKPACAPPCQSNQPPDQSRNYPKDYQNSENRCQPTCPPSSEQICVTEPICLPNVKRNGLGY